MIPEISRYIYIYIEFSQIHEYKLSLQSPPNPKARKQLKQMFTLNLLRRTTQNKCDVFCVIVIIQQRN